MGVMSIDLNAVVQRSIGILRAQLGKQWLSNRMFGVRLHAVVAEEIEKDKVLVVDLDVHQGNGTAQLFENEPRVFTFSMHGERNFPFRKERSDVDIGLPDGTGDDAYLELLEYQLDRTFEQVKPDFVFYQAGVDVLETDRLGKLTLTKRGCRRRDALVFRRCKAANVPVQVSMGGGYSSHIRDIVDAHCQTFEEAVRCYD